MLHEVKKTKAIEEAGVWQLKYYMYYLKQKGVEPLEAKIDYPLLRQTKEIVLEKEDVEIIENVIKNIQEIVTKENPPEVINEKICKKCSYYDLCYV